jgi:hypothetical protein
MRLNTKYAKKMFKMNANKKELIFDSLINLVSTNKPINKFKTNSSYNKNRRRKLNKKMK